jgi:hypothetical protein
MRIPAGRPGADRGGGARFSLFMITARPTRSETHESTVWLRRLLTAWGHRPNAPTPLYEDNAACISTSLLPGQTNRNKHFDITTYNIKDNIRELYRVDDLDHLFSALCIAFATGVLARDMQWVQRREGTELYVHLALQMFLFVAHTCVSVLAVFQVLPFDALQGPLQARHHGLSEEAASLLRNLLQTLCAAILLAPLPRWGGSLVYGKLFMQAFVLAFYTLLASAASDEAAMLFAAVMQLALLRIL